MLDSSKTIAQTGVTQKTVVADAGPLPRPAQFELPAHHKLPTSPLFYKPFGACGTVTGSTHFVFHSASGKYFAVDCGLLQGEGSPTVNDVKHLPVSPKDLHALFLTHAHADHIGNLFVWLRAGFRGKIYCTDITSKLTPGDAPAGHENWFVLVNVPPNRGQDWKALGQQTREIVLDKIEGLLGMAVRPYLVEEEILDPTGIERLTGSSFGSIYGMSSNSTMAAFNRHPNRSTRHKGLWFVSGGGHPGAGMPVVLLSAKIAAAQIGSGA